MRGVGVVAGVRSLVGAVLIVGGLLLGLRLWGLTGGFIMDVSRSEGPEAPSAIDRYEYGCFNYLSTANTIYTDREAIRAGRPGKPERIVTQRAIHWAGLVETIAVSALFIAAAIGSLLWVRNYTRRWLM